jgi:hypothetical protein
MREYLFRSQRDAGVTGYQLNHSSRRGVVRPAAIVRVNRIRVV